MFSSFRENSSPNLLAMSFCVKKCINPVIALDLKLDNFLNSVTVIFFFSKKESHNSFLLVMFSKILLCLDGVIFEKYSFFPADEDFLCTGFII